MAGFRQRLSRRTVLGSLAAATAAMRAPAVFAATAGLAGFSTCEAARVGLDFGCNGEGFWTAGEFTADACSGETGDGTAAGDAAAGADAAGGAGCAGAGLSANFA